MDQSVKIWYREQDTSKAKKKVIIMDQSVKIWFGEQDTSKE